MQAKGTLQLQKEAAAREQQARAAAANGHASGDSSGDDEVGSGSDQDGSDDEDAGAQRQRNGQQAQQPGQQVAAAARGPAVGQLAIPGASPSTPLLLPRSIFATLLAVAPTARELPALAGLLRNSGSCLLYGLVVSWRFTRAAHRCLAAKPASREELRERLQKKLEVRASVCPPLLPLPSWQSVRLCTAVLRCAVHCCARFQAHLEPRADMEVLLALARWLCRIPGEPRTSNLCTSLFLPSQCRKCASNARRRSRQPR